MMSIIVLYSGIALSVSGALGGFFGGVVLNRCEMSKMAMAKFMIGLVVAINVGFGISMTMGCPKVVYEGTTYIPSGASRYI